MKSIGNKLAAVALAAALCVSTGAVAGAASGVYDVTVADNKIVLTKNGKNYKPYGMKDGSDIKFQLNDQGNLVLVYTNEDGDRKGVSLGGQTVLNVSGDIDALTLDASLGNKIDVFVGSESEIGTMTVYSKNKIEIQGDVNLLFVTGSAKVDVTGEATINRAKVSSTNARLNAESSSTVSYVYAADSSTVRGGGISKKTVDTDDEDDDRNSNADYRTRLERKDKELTVYVGDSDENGHLDDISGLDFRDYFRAYIRDNDGDEHDVNGHYDWVDDDEKIFDHNSPGSGSYSCEVKFTPTSSRYSTATSHLTVHVVYTGNKPSSGGNSTILKPVR